MRWLLWCFCLLAESYETINHYHSRRLQNLAESIQYATEPKPNTLEINFLYKNVCEDLIFAMMNKKVDTWIGGVRGGKNHGFRGYFEVEATFLPVSTNHPHQTCRKGVFECLTSSHQYSSRTTGRKILFGNKIKVSTRWLSSFQGLFLSLTSQSLRWASRLPKARKLQNSS